MGCLQEIRIYKTPAHSYTRLSLIATPKQTQCFHLLPTCINFEFRSCFSTTCLRVGQKGLFWVVGAERCPSPVLFQAKGGSFLSGGNHFAAALPSSSFSGKLMSSCCDLTSHFWKMLCAWVCTVFSEMMSSSRMNGRLRPARSSAQICVSRSVKPYSFWSKRA